MMPGFYFSKTALTDSLSPLVLPAAPANYYIYPALDTLLMGNE